VVRFSIINGSTSEEIASNNWKIEKAVKEISTEQSKKSVNT
tara:strand:+ start:510 stop:632 length:123 start_codon:yes stop_codon:yes gene_type:complete